MSVFNNKRSQLVTKVLNELTESSLASDGTFSAVLPMLEVIIASVLLSIEKHERATPEYTDALLMQLEESVRINIEKSRGILSSRH